MQKITSTLLITDKPDRNGIIYPKSVIVDQLKKYIENDLGLGCLKTENTNSIVLQLKDASHRINSYREEYGTIFIEGEILDTPCGKIVQNIGVDKFGFELVGVYDSISKFGEVNNFKLSHIDLIDKDQCAFEECSIKEVSNDNK